MTVQRTHSQTKILRLLNQLNQEMSAHDLDVALRKAQSPLGLATVYVVLEALKLSGAVQARLLNSGEMLYSLTQIDRHPLTCLQCGIGRNS